jgi:hypothetical protein
VGLDLAVGVRDCADGSVGIRRLDVEILREIRGHNVPRVCREDFSCAFKTTGNEGRTDFLAINAEANF